MAGSNNDKNIDRSMRTKLFKSDIENEPTSVETSTKTSIEDLNDDILREIFSYFSFAEMINLDMVCTRWSSLCERVWGAVYGLATDKNAWVFRARYNALHDEILSERTVKFMLRRCGKFVKYMTVKKPDAAVCIDQLSMVLPLCPNLRCLVMNGAVSVIAMRSIRNNCVNLISLSIGPIGLECEEYLSMALVRNTQLKYFCIRSSVNETTGEFLKYITHSICDILIEADFIFLPENFISALQSFRRLRSLSLEPNNRFETSIMQAIGKATSISTLILRHNSLSNVSPDAYSHLSNLINLTELDLWSAENMSEETFINIINNCKKLSTLNIGYCSSLTNHAIRNIGKLTKLRTLYMEHVCQVTDEAIGDLPATLEKLICSKNNRIKDEGVIRLIEKAPKLKELAVNECAITMNIVVAAVNTVTKRKNRIILRLNIHGNGFSYETRGIPPLLRIVEPNRCRR